MAKFVASGREGDGSWTPGATVMTAVRKRLKTAKERRAEIETDSARQYEELSHAKAELRRAKVQREQAEQEMHRLTRQLAVIRDFVLSNRQSLCTTAERSVRMSMLEQTFCNLTDSIQELVSPEARSTRRAAMLPQPQDRDVRQTHGQTHGTTADNNQDEWEDQNTEEASMMLDITLETPPNKAGPSPRRAASPPPEEHDDLPRSAPLLNVPRRVSGPASRRLPTRHHPTSPVHCISSPLKKAWTPSRAPSCAQCQQPVYAAEAVELDTKKYHKTCVRCVECHKVLSIGSYVLMGQHFYCKPHHKAAFLAHVSAAVCKQRQRSSFSHRPVIFVYFCTL